MIRTIRSYFSRGAAICVALCASALFASVDEPVVLSMTVNSRGGCGPAKLDFVQVRPDGTADSAMYRVPDGQLLVVTDVDWLYGGGQGGLTRTLVLNLENLEDSSKKQTVFRSVLRLNADG